MSGRIGADPESLDALADQLRHFSETLRSSRRNLTSGVHERAWKGARADRFRSDWDHTYVPWMDGACEFLDHAVTVLHANANQQRTASGEAPKDYSPPKHHSLFDRAVHGVDGLVDKGVHWSADRLHDAGRELHDISETARDVVSTILESKAFDYALDGLEVVAAVAPLLALTGVGAPVALAITAVASGLVFEGHLAQMANKGEWDGWKIAGDGVGFAGSLVGLGTAGKAISLVSAAAGKLELTNTVKGVLAFQSVSEVFNVADSGHDVYVDVRDGNYGRAGFDAGMGMIGLVGGATDGPVSDAANAVSGTGGAGEDFGDTFGGSDSTADQPAQSGGW